MSFGAIVAVGDDGKVLDGEITGCMTEIRVEQSLSDLTQFAIRFQEDIKDGESYLLSKDILLVDEVISILVEGKDVEGNSGWFCLVKGPITEIKKNFTLGGPGSWFEVRGQDMRQGLDREFHRRRHGKGRVSDIVRGILSGADFDVDIQESTTDYNEEEANGITQCGTNFQFISHWAEDHDFYFWLDYDAQKKKKKFQVDITANFKTSPDNNKGGTLALPMQIMGKEPIALKVTVPDKKCGHNVTSFELDLDNRQPTTVEGSGSDRRKKQKKKLKKVAGEDQQDPLNKDGEQVKLGSGSFPPYTQAVFGAGDTAEQQRRVNTGRSRAGWKAKAKASTSAHMLGGGVLFPHDVVEVQGLPEGQNAPFQVETVTHVINAADHFMDIGLRSNSPKA